VSGRRIGPAVLRRSFEAFFRRYRALRRKGRATLFCVRGGGLFWVGNLKGKIDFVATTAPGHRTRRTGPGRQVRRLRAGGPPLPGAHHFLGALLLGHRFHDVGRVIYALNKKHHVRFLAVFKLNETKNKPAVAKQLHAIGF
jgi:hypothetical protein